MEINKWGGSNKQGGGQNGLILINGEEGIIPNKRGGLETYSINGEGRILSSA